MKEGLIYICILGWRVEFLSEMLLTIRGLKTHFFTSLGVVRAVDGVSLEINRGETVGLVGESGSGKSMTAFSVMRLVRKPGRIVQGEILFEGEDLLKKNEGEMRKMRGNRLAMSFQDPMTYLNPVIRVGNQIAEAVMLHQGDSRSQAMDKAIESMELVRIPSAADRARDFPHQLSGGMRQRVLIAIAICCKPDLLIADEPTTALDVIITGEILRLLEDLKKRLNLSILVISHDLSVVAELADKVAVTYAGRILEYADTMEIFKRPLHAYTRGLMESIPRLDSAKGRLKVLDGSTPDMVSLPTGCRFHPRCPYVKDICTKEMPELVEVEKGHMVACHIA